MRPVILLSALLLLSCTVKAQVLGCRCRLHVLRGRALISTRAEFIQAIPLNNFE
ncbi:MAG: hypothetical protein QOG58_3262 [Caballeronia sp.]|nr:hypothetical protein [Caballeronia sp.]